MHLRFTRLDFAATAALFRCGQPLVLFVCVVLHQLDEIGGSFRHNIWIQKYNDAAEPTAVCEGELNEDSALKKVFRLNLIKKFRVI